MADMTLREASQLLGVQPGADKQTVDKAARQLIRKWHPDAWRNATPDEQKKASDEFMKVTKAQKILLHPEEAAPEPGAVPSPQGQTVQQGTAYGYADAPYGPATTAATYMGRNAASSRETPYQGSRPAPRTPSPMTFEDEFGMVPDPMESGLNEMHNKDVERTYHQIADSFRATMSTLASGIMFALSFLMLLALFRIINLEGLFAEGTLGGMLVSIFPTHGGTPTALTFGLLCILMLVKQVTYDAFASYPLARKVKVLSPSILFGIELILLGFIGDSLTGFFALPHLVYLVMIILGIVALLVAIAWKARGAAKK